MNKPVYPSIPTLMDNQRFPMLPAPTCSALLSLDTSSHARLQVFLKGIYPGVELDAAKWLSEVVM